MLKHDLHIVICMIQTQERYINILTKVGVPHLLIILSHD